MLIICPKCSKSFEVNSELIPSKGRLVQCGSCDHKWHFVNDKYIEKKFVEDNIFKEETKTDKKDYKENETQIKKNKIEETEDQEILINDTNEFVDEYKENNEKLKKNKNINYFKFFIVIIISIIALITLIDTFKSNIAIFIPQIDQFLNNLYETLKDVRLFFIDLIN